MKKRCRYYDYPPLRNDWAKFHPLKKDGVIACSLMEIKRVMANPRQCITSHSGPCELHWPRCGCLQNGLCKTYCIKTIYPAQ